MPFEANKTIKELGIDITRKFRVTEDCGSGHYNKGDIFEFYGEDGSCAPKFKRISDYITKYISLYKLEYADEPCSDTPPKFKVGDSVRILTTNNHNNITKIVSIKTENGFTKYGSEDFACYYYEVELELINTPTPIPPSLKSLSNTTITDIKDDKQCERVQAKLNSLGNNLNGSCDITNLWNVIKVYSDGKYISFKDGEPSWPHITASAFLNEEPVEEEAIKVPQDTCMTTTTTTCAGEQTITLNPFCYGKPLPDFIKPRKETKIPFQNTPLGEHWFLNEFYKPLTNKTITKTSMQDNILNFFNDLTVSVNDKELRKAGLKDQDLSWSGAALDIILNLEAKERGYKNWEELEKETIYFGTYNTTNRKGSLTPLEAHDLLTKFYTKLLDTAKKYNKRNDKKEVKK